jgi:hypothetical protein
MERTERAARGTRGRDVAARPGGGARAADARWREAGRIPWVALVVLATLLAGVLVAVVQFRPATQPPPAAPEAEDAANLPDSLLNPGDEIIGRALGPVAVDSTELKNRWMDEIAGVDVSMLTAEQRVLFVRFANAQRCTCGCGFTLAACRTYDTTCPVSGPRAEELRDSVRAGLARDTTGLRQDPATPGTTAGHP